MSQSDTRDTFEPAARRAAAHILGSDPLRFSPQRMSKYAHWYEDSTSERLVAVVNPDEKAVAGDEALAFGLAWQQDRDLILVLPREQQTQALVRLPWIQTHVRVWGFNGTEDPAPIPPLSRGEALYLFRNLGSRARGDYMLHPGFDGWLDGIDKNGLVGHARSCLSWHFEGLQVLRVTGTDRGPRLRIQAGVQYSTPQAGSIPFDRVFSQPPTTVEVDEINVAVRGAIEHGKSATSNMGEHRMQSVLQHQASDLGLTGLLREYPGFRGPGSSSPLVRARPGYIDFLGLDAAGGFHVVETKIGHDVGVVLQALDYAIFVEANEGAIRATIPEVGVAPVPRFPVPIHLVLAGKQRQKAFNGYLAGQIEALSGDIDLTIHLVDDIDETPMKLATLARADMWTASADVAAPAMPPRWPHRLTASLAKVGP